MPNLFNIASRIIRAAHPNVLQTSARFFSHSTPIKTHTTDITQLARAISLTHPAHGPLYGPFLHSCPESSFKGIIQQSCLLRLEKETGIVGYFPNLIHGKAELRLLTDLLGRSDFMKPNLVFYTPRQPEIRYQSHPGVEVFWEKGVLLNHKLPIIPALSNQQGHLEFHDKVLVESLRNVIEKATQHSPHQKIYQEYLSELFASEAKDIHAANKPSR